MSKQLRVAVVGLGHWAEWAHLPGSQRDPRRGSGRGRGRERRPGRAGGQGVQRRQGGHGLPRGPRRRHDRRGRRRDRQRHPFPDLLGFHRGRQTRSLREASAPRRPGDQPHRRAGAVQGTQDQARLHLPLRAGRAVCQGAHRPGFRRRTLHVQRLRAEQPVDQTPRRRSARPRPPTPMARRSPSRPSRVTARRPSTSCTGGSASPSRRWSAPCATSSPNAPCGARKACTG